MYEVALKSLFTRVELFFMKNQHSNCVLFGKKNVEVVDDSSDWVPVDINHEPKTGAFKQLYQGVFPV